MKLIVFRLVFVTGVLHAQQDSTTCYAGGGTRLWPDAAWQSGQDTMSRSADFVVKTLGGSYRMIVVETEGPHLRRWGSEWDLRLEVPPADSVRRWARKYQDRANVFPLWGSRRLVRLGYLDGDVRPVPPDSVVLPVRMVYFGGERLHLEVAPFDVMDGGGGIFYLGEVGDSGDFSGRWVDGSIALYITSTPLGLLGEPSRGYFCSFPNR